MLKKFLASLTFLSLMSCSGLEESEKEKIRRMNATGEYIYRTHDETLFAIEPPKRQIRSNYPWEDSYIGTHIRITKEFFRCRGSSQNPPLMKQVNGQNVHSVDCGGKDHHSLPLKEGKEFIYPALIELLNFIQEKTQKKVIITCGHRCPAHNSYADLSVNGRTSKHMIGAEVDFYVQGMEWSPEKIITLVEQYYQEHPLFKEDSKFTTFKRFEKETDVSTLPWYNKEVFIKIFKKDEGRDGDNSHRLPYICLQLKWDRDKDEAVTYSWFKAFNGYLRY